MKVLDQILGYPIRPATTTELEHLRDVYTWLLHEWQPTQAGNRQVELGMGDVEDRPALLTRLSVVHTSPVDGATHTLWLDAASIDFEPGGPVLACLQNSLERLALGLARYVCARWN